LAHFNLAAALTVEGQWRESIAEFREAVRLLRGFARARTQLAWQLAMCPDIDQRDIDGALRQAERAVELAPRDASAHAALGAARYRLGRWADAVAALNASLEINGEQIEAWLLLAMAHWQLGDETEAIQWYEKARRWPKASALDESVRRLRDEAAELLGQTP
jgi:tetratricopeptide (TPR) repeat protein